MASVSVSRLTWSLDPTVWLKETQGKTADKWQAKFMRSSAKRIILNCARQSGKSTVVSWRLAWNLMFKPGYFAVCAARSDRQALELFQKVKKALESAGSFDEKPEKDNLHELVLSNGSRLVCLPANPDTVRGFSAANEVLVDEASTIDDALFVAVIPMLVRSKGSLVLLSTPAGQRGYFYEVWVNGEGWERYEIPWRDTVEAGHITKAEIDQFKHDLGEHMFKQEYECTFLSTVDAVFPLEQVTSALDDNEEPWDW